MVAGKRQAQVLCTDAGVLGCHLVIHCHLAWFTAATSNCALETASAGALTKRSRMLAHCPA